MKRGCTILLWTFGFVATAQESVLINELQAANRHTYVAADGSTPDWVELFNPSSKEVEITVTGTVHYKDDNRPASGVSISAAGSDADAYGRWGESDWAKSMRERPRANPRGSTTTDGEGKFTLKLTVTASNGEGISNAARRVYKGAVGNA